MEDFTVLYIQMVIYLVLPAFALLSILVFIGARSLGPTLKWPGSAPSFSKGNDNA